MSYVLDSSLGEIGDLTPRREQQLKEMAKWPHEAHGAFGKLSSTEQTLVVLQMAANYGAEFAKQFRSQLGKRPAKDIVQHHYGPGVGPSPTTLQARGYRLAQKDSVNEWWVHPSGESVMRNYRLDKAGTSAPPPPKPQPAPRPQQPQSVRCRDLATLRNSTCYNADQICRIAAELNEEPARERCAAARKSCEQARQSSERCS